MDYHTVLSEVESWPVEDQIRLLRDLCSRLPDEVPTLELSDEMKAELARQIEALEQSTDAAISWDVVDGRLQPRFTE